MQHFLPNNITEALEDISSPRLSSYRSFFKSPTDPAISDDALYGIYCWNDAISSRLMRLIGIIEIILRNRIHRELSNFAFIPGVSNGTQTSNNWYRFVIMDNTETAKLVKKKSGGSLSSNTPATKVIAGMTYGFWPRILQISHTNAHALIPWSTMIPRIFPKHQQQASTYWAVQHHQDQLFARLDLIGDLRNRIAHFEPIWKFKALKSEWIQRTGYPVVEVSPAPTNSDEAIARLRLVYTRVTQLLYWLSKDRASDYMMSENHFCLDWLLSKDALEEYKNIGSEKKFRLGSLTKSWGLKLKLRERKSFLIVDKSIPVGLFYRLYSK